MTDHDKPMSMVERGPAAKRLKAYAVLEDCENTGGIIFAKSDVEARRRGADEFNDSDFSSVTCRRAPWADEYANGAVPASVMIDFGWHFECVGCGETIDEDWLDESGKTSAGVIGTQHSRIFCDQACKDAHVERERRRSVVEGVAVEYLRQRVLKRFPDGIEFVTGFGKEHVYVTERDGFWFVKQASVSFNFPGMKVGPASLQLDLSGNDVASEPVFYCCGGDKEAFEAFAESTKSTESK